MSKAIGYSHDSKSSRRVCSLGAVLLGHVTDAILFFMRRRMHPKLLRCRAKLEVLTEQLDRITVSLNVWDRKVEKSAAFVPGLSTFFQQN